MVCGRPIFYQEVAIGQYLGVGGMTLIAELAPIMKGFVMLQIVTFKSFVIDLFFLMLFPISGVGYATMVVTL